MLFQLNMFMIDSPVILKFLFTVTEMIIISKYSFPSLYSSTVLPIVLFCFVFSNIYLFGSTRSQVWHVGLLAAGYGTKLGPLHWEHGVSATGPPGKAHANSFHPGRGPPRIYFPGSPAARYSHIIQFWPMVLLPRSVAQIPIWALERKE